MMKDNILSVRQLNLYVRSLIESDASLMGVAVSGEISNFKDHYSSGHWYFTLKDNDAAIRCVMFRQQAQRVRFKPQDGEQVILRGRVSIYEKDGQYQFYAEDMTASGMGDIALAFKHIKERLEKEGLFDAHSKRPIPKFPERIAVITSPTGAAVRDIFNILTRRWPITKADLFPVSVQGESAAPEMIAALKEVYGAEKYDLIIIGRGGGSVEDLWAFNDEGLARTIFESPIPVISAVGHETDFSISDFAADLRAPTPSAAAELAVPDMAEIRKLIEGYEKRIENRVFATIGKKKAVFDGLCSSVYLKNPAEMLVDGRRITLDRSLDKLENSAFKKLSEAKADINGAIIALDGLSPLKTLTRGYSVVTKDRKGITDSAELTAGDELDITFKKGGAHCKVLSTETDA